MRAPEANRLSSALVWVGLFLLANSAAAETVVVTRFDSDGIAAAIEQSQPGDTVGLPAGVYTTTEAIRPKSQTRLVGAGQGKTVMRFAADAPSLMLDLSGCEDVEVAGLTLDGGSSPNAQQGISAGNARRLRIHHVTVRNLVKGESFGPHGIYFTGINPTRANGVTDSVICDCILENIGVDSEWGAGIRLGWGSSRNQVLRNIIHNTGRGGILCDNGSTDLVIQKNRVSGSGGEGLGIEVWGGCDRAVIEDNRVDHWLSVGGCDYCGVRRNTVSDKSGDYKFAGLEIIGSYCVVTDNRVDDGQQIGISVSGGPPKDYLFWGYNTVRNCIQWGAQLQGDGEGISCHYFYRCRFLKMPIGRGRPWYPGDEGNGFRALAKVHHVTLEECEMSENGRYGVQLVGDSIDFFSFVRCIIEGNAEAAVAGPSDYTALEWVGCSAEGNGDDRLPPGKPFPVPGPAAAFDAPAAVRVGETVTFTDRSRARSGIAKALWDFNDGVPATEASTTHTYQRAGNYRVTLVVWDAEGRGARATRWVKVLGAD